MERRRRGERKNRDKGEDDLGGVEEEDTEATVEDVGEKEKEEEV